MIKVNEIFGPTVQGEGKNAGKPVVFLRLSSCNLHCIWCDTPHTWNWEGTKFAHPIKFDQQKEEHQKPHDEVLATILNKSEGTTKSLVISGGEPLLQQKQLIPLLQDLKKEGWYVEVETNGTVPLRPEFADLIDQINCSPKLANSLDPESLRIKKKTLAQLAANPKVNFKFVTATEGDMVEILEIVELLRQSGNPEIRLMPLCQTREELEMREPLIKELSAKHNFIYCTRLSILMSGTKRGV